MIDGQYHLAIETSSRDGSIALGRDGELLCERALPAGRRHNVELLSAVDGLFADQGVARTSLGIVSVSIGPGSFTGLRTAVAAAKMFALALGSRLIAAPTVDVVALGAADASAGDFARGADGGLLVCLSLKRHTAYTCLYRWDSDAAGWRAAEEAGLRTGEQIIALAEAGPVLIVGDHVPDEVAAAAARQPNRLAIMTGDGPIARASHVFELGCALAAAGRFVDPHALAPLYVRPPEAVEQWERRQQAEA